MIRHPDAVELHYALWVVLSIPLAFAGLFFLLPGLGLINGLSLLAVSTLLLIYVAALTRGRRDAWIAGLVVHLALVIGAVYYVPLWPDLLAVPLALFNVYSAVVLLTYRRHWLEPATGRAGGPARSARTDV